MSFVLFFDDDSLLSLVDVNSYGELSDRATKDFATENTIGREHDDRCKTTGRLADVGSYFLFLSFSPTDEHSLFFCGLIMLFLTVKVDYNFVTILVYKLLEMFVTIKGNEYTI